MMDKSNAYASKQGGVVVEETVLGFNIVVHHPANSSGSKKRVAQAHADAILAKTKKLSCSAQQKKELIDDIIHSEQGESEKVTTQEHQKMHARA